MVLILLGEPKSTQHIYRYACRGNHPAMYMSAEGKTLKESYQWQARSQWKRKPLAKSLQIAVKLYHGTKRVTDWDNFHKLSMDALTGIVWLDDSQIQEADVCKFYDKENPRIEIIINELP